MPETTFHKTFSTSHFWLSRAKNGSESGLRSAMSYRFGFNGQEMDNEITGQTGTHTTAMFWEYDTRLGRRWNLDPKPQIGISNYACFQNNPIWFSDPFGDTLTISRNKQSKEDIRSLAKTENQKYITFKRGRVGLDFGKMSEEERSEILNSDEGLSLINDVVSCKENILYEALDYALINDESNNKTNAVLYLYKDFLINASNNGKDALDAHNQRPKSGFDGQVVIAPDFVIEEQKPDGSIIIKSRASIVFHELEENYQRTHNGIDYNGENGAHNLAIKRELDWHGKSSMPGQGVKAYNTKPDKHELKRIGRKIKNYFRG